jgi:dolichol-phosphate mannosyltransferase
MNKKIISIIIPIYNEENIIKYLIQRLQSTVDRLDFNFEFIFVNDGSSDNSLELLTDLMKTDKRIKIVDLSRNFGQQMALTAGIDYAKGDAVILMDSDMEDKPEDIAKFLEKWREGYEVVYAIRKERKVSFLKKICFGIFHVLNKMLSEVPMEPAGIFGLINRRAVEKLKNLKEQARFIPGLRSWVGFRQVGIELERGERYDQKPRVNFGKLVILALNSYFSFSKKPLMLASLLGIFLSFLSFSAAILIIIFRFAMKFKVPGWASMVVIILFIASMQFICIGIIGEYIGRIFDEVKRRPLYIVDNLYGFDIDINIKE